jgi:transcription elongation factor Elf1
MGYVGWRLCTVGDTGRRGHTIMDQSRDADDAHDPEDRTIFELTCPRCGTRLPTASQLLLDREPSRESVICPSCGYDVRLITDPTLA